MGKRLSAYVKKKTASYVKGKTTVAKKKAITKTKTTIKKVKPITAKQIATEKRACGYTGKMTPYIKKQLEKKIRAKRQ